MVNNKFKKIEVTLTPSQVLLLKRGNIVKYKNKTYFTMPFVFKKIGTNKFQLFSITDDTLDPELVDLLSNDHLPQ